DVDVRLLRDCVGEAQGMGVSFHRAIDESADLESALEAAAELGAERVLTSGGARTAPEAIQTIKHLTARGRELGVSVMAGSGLTVELLPSFIRETCVTEV